LSTTPSMISLATSIPSRFGGSISSIESLDWLVTSSTILIMDFFYFSLIFFKTLPPLLSLSFLRVATTISYFDGLRVFSSTVLVLIGTVIFEFNNSCIFACLKAYASSLYEITICFLFSLSTLFLMVIRSNGPTILLKLLSISGSYWNRLVVYLIFCLFSFIFKPL